MVDDEEGEDGEDDGEEGDDDDEDGDGADGDTGSVSRAGSEAKPDEMEITPTRNQAAEGLGATRLSSSEELPAANINLSAPLPPPLPIEGSPLKQVISAQSPGSLDLDSPSQENVLKAPATSDGAEQTRQPVEPGPSFPPATDAGVLDESPGGNDMVMADEDVGMDLDSDMQDVDVAPIITGTSIDTAVPLNTGDSSVALADTQNSAPMQTVDSGDPITAEFGVDEEARKVTTIVEPTLENAEIGGTGIAPSGDLQALGNTTETTLPAEAAVENATDPLLDSSLVQATDGRSADGQPISVPGIAESQDEQSSLPQTQEENAAYSPDLFSGLEAALNQHGHGSSEPIPERSEAAESRPEASHQSESKEN